MCRKIESSLMLFLIFTCIWFGIVRTIENEQFDYFTFTTWGLSNEILSNNHLLFRPYINVPYKSGPKHHANEYSVLFLPHTLLSISYIVTSIPYQYYSLIIVLSYIIILYLITKYSLHHKFVIFLTTLLLIIYHQTYPTYSFFYISIGILFYWYTLFILLHCYRSALRLSSSVLTGFLFLIASNWSYYTSTFMTAVVSFGISLTLLITRLFSYRLPSQSFTITELKLYFTTSMGAIFLLVFLNPIVLSLGDTRSGLDFNYVLTFLLREAVHWYLPSAGDNADLEEYFVDSVYPVLHTISTVSVFLLVILLIILMVRYKVNIVKMIFKDKDLNLSTILLFALLVLVITHNLVYALFLYPSIHTYPHQVLRTFAIGMLIMLVIKVSNKIKIRYRNWFLVIAYMLAILLVLAPLYRSIVTSISMDHVTPIKLYSTSTSSITFLTEKTKNELFLFTDSRIAGYVYYRLTHLNESIIINVQGFLAPPFNYFDNCKRIAECYYLIARSFKTIPLRIAQAPWIFIKPLGEKYCLMIEENSLIYNDSLSEILLVVK